MFNKKYVKSETWVQKDTSGVRGNCEGAINCSRGKGNNIKHSNHLIQASRKNRSLPRQLASNHTGCMGPKHCSGSGDSILQLSSTIKKTTPLSHVAEQHLHTKEGSIGPPAKRSHNTSTPGRGKGQFLFKSVFGAQEGWSYETSNKPKEPEPKCCHTPFQDGGYAHSPRHSKAQSWLTKIDLKDAYFNIPVAQKQKFLRFSIENEIYQFTCLPFGLSGAPWAFTLPRPSDRW